HRSRRAYRQRHRGASAPGRGAENHRLPAPPSPDLQRRPPQLRKVAVSRRSTAKFDGLPAQTILAGPSLLEIPARRQRAQQRQETALGRLQLGADLAKGERVAAGRHQLQDIDDPVRRAMAALGDGARPGGAHARSPTRGRSAATSKPKSRAALRPRIFARAWSERSFMVRSMATITLGTRSRYFASTRVAQRSAGSLAWASAGTTGELQGAPGRAARVHAPC